jgi:hypothetical protein
VENWAEEDSTATMASLKQYLCICTPVPRYLYSCRVLYLWRTGLRRTALLQWRASNSTCVSVLLYLCVCTPVESVPVENWAEEDSTATVASLKQYLCTPIPMYLYSCRFLYLWRIGLRRTAKLPWAASSSTCVSVLLYLCICTPVESCTCGECL